MARLVVATVAAVAVAYFSGGNPVLAAQTFAFVYGVTGFLDPNSKLLGPKLTDLTAPKANYGEPIAYLKGTIRVAGNVIYATDKVPVENTTSEGKGGPGVDSTTFTYKMDMMIEVSCNQLGGLRRVFSNGKLKWTHANDADGASLAASRLANDWEEIRFYNGNDAQLPDPDYEAAVGVGEAPAYRGRTTIFIKGLNLGSSGQVPMLTFEVSSEAGLAATDVTMGTVPCEGGATWTVGSPTFSPTGFQVHVGQWDNSYATSVVKVYEFGSTGESIYQGQYNALMNQPPSRGQTDKPGLMSGYLRDSFWHEWAVVGATVDDGIVGELSTWHFQAPIGVDMGGGGGNTPFAIAGDVVILASGATGVLYRFSKAASSGVAVGVPLATSAALPALVNSVATDGTWVYASRRGAINQWYKLDAATLTLVGTYTFPITNGQGWALTCDENGALYGFVDNPYPGDIYLFNGTTWEKSHPAVYLGYSIGSNGASVGVSGGVGFVLADAVVHEFYPTVTQASVRLDALVLDLAARTKQIAPSQLDVSELTTDYVKGLGITQVSATRTTLETLCGAFFFEMVESGSKIICKKRGRAASRTIPFADLGISSDGTEEPFPRQKLNDVEFPKQIAIKFANSLNNYQTGTETGDRLITTSTSNTVTELPLVLTPAEAKKIADVLTNDLQTSLITVGPIKMATKHLDLEPGDVINVVDREGNSFRTRIMQVEVSDFLPSHTLVIDDATAVNSVAATDSTYEGSTLLRVLSDTQLLVLDAPLLRDADNALGPYVAVYGDSPWPGAEIDKSIDGVSYAKVVTIGDKTVLGTASSVLPNFAGGVVFDEASTVLVTVGDGTLSSYTKDEALAGTAGTYLIGSEVVIACLATLVTPSPNVYRLSSLLRGRRGTEWATGTHVSGEKFVRLQTTGGMRKLTDESADLNATRYYKGVSIGKSLSSVTGKSFVDTGVVLKPFAPVDLRYDSTTGVISWKRRTRFSTKFTGATGSVVPLGEASEGYDVELYNASSVLVDSATVTVPSWTVSKFQGGDYIIPPIWGMRVISTERLAVRDDLPYVGNLYAKAEYLVRLNTDGTINQQSPALGNGIAQWANNGDTIYAVSYDVSSVAPNPFTNSKLHRLARTTLDTVSAVVTAGTAGDWQGVAHDGTDLWVSERTSNNVRKMNSTSLASVAAYAVAGGPSAMQYVSGKLWIVCLNSNQVVKWDVATHTEDLRFSVVPNPFSVMTVGGLVFVLGSAAIGVYNATTGALVVSYAYGPFPRQLELWGTYITILCITPAAKLLLLDSTTGAVVDLITPPIAEPAYIAGGIGADLYITGRPGPGFSEQTRKYAVAPPVLTGYSIKVWQRSAIVGRGYVSTLGL